MLEFFSGFAVYHVRFLAIVFKPLEKEVLEGIVVGVNRTSVVVESGPLMGEHLVTVERHQMPTYMGFHPEDTPQQWKGNTPDTQNFVLKEGTKVRIRILNVNPAGRCLATMKDAYLGPLMRE